MPMPSAFASARHASNSNGAASWSVQPPRRSLTGEHPLHSVRAADQRLLAGGPCISGTVDCLLACNFPTRLALRPAANLLRMLENLYSGMRPVDESRICGAPGLGSVQPALAQSSPIMTMVWPLASSQAAEYSK